MIRNLKWVYKCLRAFIRDSPYIKINICREICDVVFKAKAKQKIGRYTFEPGQPVLYIDTATTSTLEGAATTVYAQGGRGNSRLIAWEG